MDDENGKLRDVRRTTLMDVQETNKVGIVNKLFMGVVGLGMVAVSLAVFMGIAAGLVWVGACYAGVMVDVIEDAFRAGRDLF